jgi:hypothetical protein
VPNTAHILQFTLSKLWYRPYTKYLQLLIFRLPYSALGICTPIADIATILRALYWKFDVKYSAHPPVYAIWTVVSDIYNVITAPHIQGSIFDWTLQRYYWRYLDNAMLVILQSWCQIQRTSSGLRYVNCGPGHIQCNCSSAYAGFNIRLNVSVLLLQIIGHTDARYTTNLVPNIAHMLPFTVCDLWSRTYTM